MRSVHYRKENAIAREKSALAACDANIRVAQLRFAAAFDAARNQLQTAINTAQATAEAAVKTAQEDLEENLRTAERKLHSARED